MHNRMSLQDEPQYKRQCLYLNALIHCPRSRSHRARRLCCEELEHELDRSRAKPIASVHLFDAERHYVRSVVQQLVIVVDNARRCDSNQLRLGREADEGEVACGNRFTTAAELFRNGD